MAESVNPAPAVAVVLNRDLLFGSRIRGALANLGIQPRFVANTATFVEALETLQGSSAIGIIDMNSAVAWDELGAGLGRIENVAPTLAFGSHKDVESMRAAKTAGVTRVVSNSTFHGEMQNLIDRYRRR